MNKDKIFQCNNEVTHGRGYVYSLKYPIVWCTNYHKQIFVNGLNAGCKSTCIYEEGAKRIPNVRFTYLEIKSKLWGGHLWNPSYFVATVSERTEEQIKTYSRNQKSK